MHKKFAITFTLALYLSFFPLSIQAYLGDCYPELLKKCLEDVYQLDSDTTGKILQKFYLFPNTSGKKALIDEFLHLSETVSLSQHMPDTLGECDAVIKALNTHYILFENDKLRILEVIVSPGDTVPSHSHQWHSILITLQGSRFRIEDTTISEEDWKQCVESIEGSLNPHPCVTNIGSQKFQAIVFEIKK